MPREGARLREARREEAVALTLTLASTLTLTTAPDSAPDPNLEL